MRRGSFLAFSSLRTFLLALVLTLLAPAPGRAAPDAGRKKSDGAGEAKAAPATRAAKPPPALVKIKKIPVERFLSASGKRHIKVKSEKALNKGLGKVPKEVDPKAPKGSPPKEIDRSSPKTAWKTFLATCKDQRWGRAAHLFNLGDVKRLEDRPAVGAAGAQKLCEVLRATRQLSAANLPASTVGPIVDDKPSNYVVVARFTLEDGERGEVWLRRTQDLAGKRDVWLITRRTLNSLPHWHNFLVRGMRQRQSAAVINVGLGPIPAALKLVSPRAAASTFLKLVRKGEYATAAHLLDLRQLPAATQKRKGARLVRRLSFVLERLRPGFAASLSNDPPGAVERDVPYDQEQILATKVGDQKIVVRLAQYRRKKAQAVWMFSAATVAAINKLYGKYGPGWAGDYLPPLFFNVKVAQVQLWQWIGLLMVLALALILGRIASFFSRKLLLKAAQVTTWQWDDQLVAATRGPMTMLYGCLGFAVLVGLLALADAPEKVAYAALKLVSIISTGWFITRALDVAGEVMLTIFSERNDEVGMAMVPVARKIVKPIVILLVLIVALQNIGLNVAGLLAGLGIGGLALAMASKSTLENMLGGITIAFDRPFKVGDFVRVGDLIGAVEEVGLRSTRVRTLDRTIVTVPNGKMADSSVENYSKRDRIRLVFKIGVQYDSSIDQVRYIVDEIKREVLKQPKIVHEGFRVRFIGFGDSSMDIEIYVYVDTLDYNEFTAIREDVYIKIAHIVEDSGAQFAFPTRTIYEGKASSADNKKAKAAAEKVHKRLADGVFSIPEIPDELRDLVEVKPDPSEEESA